MNLEHFIAKRLITAKDHKSSISAPIIKIAIIAIALGVIMMMVSIATGIGLQQKIRQKVAAFNGHIIISNFNGNQSDVSTEPVSTNQKFYPKFKNIEGISYVQAVATKAGMIRTESAFEGIVFKGVGKDYNWENLKEYLIQGKLPNLKSKLNNEILISEYLRSDQVGSFEVFIDDFTKIEEKGDEVYGETSSILNSQTIVKKFSYIFDWLKLFDTNIMVILIIMIVVSTINMVVALLVLILERTQMIGILKSMGANNWSIRKIFLYNALYLIVRGLFWGNLIGIGLLLIQKYFGVIKLNPESYYVNVAPVDINLGYFLLLNIGTLLICLLVLLIPSYIITKISPAKTIRVD